MAPLPVRALPAEGQDGVQLSPPVPYAVACDRDVGNEAEVKEEHADGQIRRDGEYVPHQRRLKIDPQVTLVGVGKQPVEIPGSPKVNDRKQTGGHHREDGHRLGGPRDRRAPAGAKQEQDGGDQRAGMGDPDPKHEVGDVNRPHHGRVIAGDTETGPNLVGEGVDAQCQDGENQAETGHVHPAGWPQRAQNILVDFPEAHSGSWPRVAMPARCQTESLFSDR